MTTQAFRDVVYPETTDRDLALLVLIEHEDLATPIRLTTAAGTWDEARDGYFYAALGEEWISAAIEVDLPAQSEEAPSARIVVPNVDQLIGKTLDEIYTAATVTIWAVLEHAPSFIVGGPHTSLMLRDVRGDALAFEGRLERPDLSREPWPKEWIRPAKYVAAMRTLGR